MKRGDGKEWGREGGASEVSQSGPLAGQSSLPVVGGEGLLKKDCLMLLLTSVLG